MAGPVGADTPADAIAQWEHLRGHLPRILPLIGAGDGGGPIGRVVRTLEAAAGEWVSRAELARPLGGHVPAADVGAALDAFESEGRVERRSILPGTKEGPPGEEWRARPWQRANRGNLAPYLVVLDGGWP